MRDQFHWARILSFVTGLVNQELLLRNEYLAAENRILRAHLPATPHEYFYHKAWSPGNASLSCCNVHSAVGWAVTL
jgi:hypothetical protein